MGHVLIPISLLLFNGIVAIAAVESACVEDGSGSFLLQKAAARRAPTVVKNKTEEPEVQPEKGVCVARDDIDKTIPIEDVLKQYPGQDGWCVYGSFGPWARECAVARQKGDVLAFSKVYSPIYSYILTGPNATQKTYRMPSGQPLTTRDHYFPLDDVYCFVNGWYDLDRQKLINNYTYLEQVSEAYCQSLEATLPYYHRLSMKSMDVEAGLDEWSFNHLTNLPQSVITGMKVHGAVKCLLGGGKGAVCDLANCARRACLLADGSLGYDARGECPPV